MRRAHWKAAEMHSDLDQKAREDVMLGFRSGRIDIVIATDILARGIDIDDISMVVNYDVPREAEDYVHRVGRTARANTDGMAVTFVSERDQPRFAFIEHFLGKDVRKAELPPEIGNGPQYRPDTKDRKRHGSKLRKPGKPRKADKTKETAAEAEIPQTIASATETPDNKPRKKRRRWYGPRKKQ